MKSLTLITFVLASALSLSACSSAMRSSDLSSVDESNWALTQATNQYAQQHYSSPPFESVGVSGLSHSFMKQDRSCSRITFTLTSEGKTKQHRALFCQDKYGVWRAMA